jgi:hypothetical protein
MQSRVYTEDELDEWREWFDRLDSPGPYHTPEYISLLAGEFEYDSERAEAFVYGSEDAFVYYPYIRRSLDDLPFADNAVEDPSQYSDIVSSWYYGGPLLSNGADSSIAGDSLQAFTEFCATEGIISEFIRFDPNRCNHEIFSELEPMFNRETVYVDFSKDEETLWDEFEKRNRNAIRQAKETDLVIEPTCDPDEFEAFYEIYTNAMEAKDASSHYRFSLSFFEKLFATDFATLTVARYGDEIVGGAVVVHENGIAHDYLRASNPDYWDMRVNNLLCYETMMEMRERGFKRFDFQGGRPGVFKFKKGFSTEDRGEFYIAKQTHLPDIYDQLKSAASDFGIDVSTGYFPAYRREKSN